MYVHLIDASFKIEDIVGFGRVDIPYPVQEGVDNDGDVTMSAISVYLQGFDNPVVVTYNSRDERDEDFAKLVSIGTIHDGN